MVRHLVWEKHMPDNLGMAVEKLRASAHRLNTICDTAAQLMKDVEDFLEECHVGVSASVSLGYGACHPEADTPDWEDFLSYRRSESGKFRLVVVRKDVEPPHEEEFRAWSECSRDEKIASLARLPDLLIELSKLVNEKTDKAQQAMAAVAPLLGTVKKRKVGQ